jgi:hypothetical protein
MQLAANTQEQHTMGYFNEDVQTFDDDRSPVREIRSRYGAAYMVARNAVWMRVIARALGHPQGPTPIYCDNTCAVGLATDTLKTAKTKAIDLRFHWLRDRVRQGQFSIHWVATDDNIADFFTKALPVYDHIRRTHQLVVYPTIHKPHRAARAYTWRNVLKPKL